MPLDLEIGAPERTCAEVRDELATGIHSAPISQHLEQCPSCAKAAQEIMLLRQLARALPCPAMPRTGHQRSLRPQLMPALAGVLTLGICTVSLWFFTGSQPGLHSSDPKLLGAQESSDPNTPVDILEALENARVVWNDSTSNGAMWLDLSSDAPTAMGQQAELQKEGSPAPNTVEEPQTEEPQTMESSPSLALFDDPLGSLDSAGAAWAPPEIIEHI